MYAAIHSGRGKGNIAPWRRKEMGRAVWTEKRGAVVEDKRGKKRFFFLLPTNIWWYRMFGPPLIRCQSREGQRTDGGGGTYKCHVGFCASSSRVCDTHNPFHICAVCWLSCGNTRRMLFAVWKAGESNRLWFFLYIFFTPPLTLNPKKLLSMELKSWHAVNMIRTCSHSLWKLSGVFV